VSSASGDRPVRRRFPEGTTADDLKAFMDPFVARLGFRFNDDDEFVADVLEGELEVLERDGDIFCPCRVRTNDPKEDVKIVCPCIPFYLDEFNAMRKCWCGLFVRSDVEDGSELHGVIEAPEGPVDVRVASVGDLRDGQGMEIMVGKKKYALFRADGSFYCLANICKHWGAPLGEGFVDGFHVMCPWHGWRFDVRDGTTDHPDADVRTYPVHVRGDDVFVTLEIK
jgi:nitrite reductase/ring-hydroxylating ferredoxin subunit/ferredoxin-thioredoxin reductase catalytic subunit